MMGSVQSIKKSRLHWLMIVSVLYDHQRVQMYACQPEQLNSIYVRCGSALYHHSTV
jgi:hypothetical protein